MKIIKQYSDGFRWVDGATESFPFKKDSDQYKALLAEGCEEVNLTQSDLDLIAKQEQEQEQEKTQTAINDTYNQKIKAIIGNVPKWESDTFPIQASEARAYSAAQAQDPEGDHSGLAPNLQRLANKRSITLDVLVPRVIVKADAYEPAAFNALGDKHAEEDLL